MVTLLDRLKGDVPDDPQTPADEKISAHYFYSALVGVADGQFTRSQVETKWSIGTAGTDKAQLDIIFNGYAAAVDKGRYLNALHAVFMLIESGEALTSAQITDWLTAAEAAY